MMFRTLTFLDRRTGAVLTRRFGVLSLLVIGLITTALYLVITYSLKKDMLDREWGITADYVRTEALHHLVPADFADPGNPAAAAHFRAFYRQTIMLPEIVRVKVYDSDMAVIWSDEPRLRGQRFPDNPHLRGAVAGRTTVNIEVGETKGENIYERDQFERLVEVYVPIVFPGTTTPAGVVETYKAPTRVFLNIEQARLTVLVTALFGGTFLYLSLFGIVRRAGRRIDDQHRALEDRGRELAAANEELRSVQQQLLEAERLAAIGEVVTAVAHGIRNPLANIRAAAQVASLDCGGCAGSKLAPQNLVNIVGEVDRLEGRLKELLQFVRPAERSHERLDLNAVVREALQMAAGQVGKGDISLRERLAPSLPPIPGSPMLLEQIFLSLVGNAIDAMPEGGGTITVTTGTEPDPAGFPRAFVEIGDTGPGIAGDVLPKIFEPFYTTKAQGTGLGLAIARKFTEAHGGTIAVSSRPGEGTAFRVSLPANTGS